MKENNTLQNSIRGRTKRTLTDGYIAFKAQEDGAENKLLELIRRFALAKVKARIADLGEVSRDAEDLVQEVLIEIWGSLGDFRGDETSFYGWVHSICFRQFSRAAGEIKMEGASRIALQVVDPEDGHKIDNPAMRPECRPQFARELPDSIQGVDRRICEYMRSGFTRKKIADFLSTSEDAVNKRVSRMKRRIIEEQKTRAPLPDRLGRDIEIPGSASCGTSWAGVRQ